MKKIQKDIVVIFALLFGIAGWVSWLYTISFALKNGYWSFQFNFFGEIWVELYMFIFFIGFLTIALVWVVKDA